MTEKKWNGAIAVISIPVAVVIVISIIGIILYNEKKETYQDVYRDMYQETEALLEKRAYDEALVLLEERREAQAEGLYFDEEEGYAADAIRKQRQYESYAYSAVNSLKTYLKNPEFCEPYQIVFYNSFGEKGGWRDAAGAGEADYPVCIMKYGVKNGSGSKTTGYALCVYSEKAGAYALLGTCPSLEEKAYDAREGGDGSDRIICRLINRYRKGGDKAGSIPSGRLRKMSGNLERKREGKWKIWFTES